MGMVMSARNKSSKLKLASMTQRDLSRCARSSLWLSFLSLYVRLQASNQSYLINLCVRDRYIIVALGIPQKNRPRNYLKFADFLAGLLCMVEDHSKLVTYSLRLKYLRESFLSSIFLLASFALRIVKYGKGWNAQRMQPSTLPPNGLVKTKCSLVEYIF